MNDYIIVVIMPVLMCLELYFASFAITLPNVVTLFFAVFPSVVAVYAMLYILYSLLMPCYSDRGDIFLIGELLSIIISTVIAITTFNILSPIFIALMPSYGMYFLVCVGYMAMAAKLFTFEKIILDSCIATFFTVCFLYTYPLMTLHLISKFPISLIIVPHLLSITLAIGAGLMASVICSYIFHPGIKQIFGTVNKIVVVDSSDMTSRHNLGSNSNDRRGDGVYSRGDAVARGGSDSLRLPQ